MKLLSIDTEISDVFDLKPNENMKKYAPFHISVAATAIYKGKEQTWFSFDDVTEHYLLNLSPEHAHALLENLDQMQRKGYMVCSWNGLSFDFKWLGYQANDIALAARIALKSYDPMFQFFNIAGFPVKLFKGRRRHGHSSKEVHEWCKCTFTLAGRAPPRSN